MPDVDEKLFGRDLFGEVIKPQASGVVAQRFLIPPFSILDAKQGDWQDRKRAWVGLGLKSEVGRGENTLGFSKSTEEYRYNKPEYTQSTKSYQIHDWMNEKGGGQRGASDGTSIFDPVLCELAYRWFCPAGGQVVDPFAGGSVRGIVAGALGRRYWGCDLRAEQIAANGAQANAIPTDPRPEWIVGDAMYALDSAPEADFIFSCPPYGDLEVYSDDPKDLSAMSWDGFVTAYGLIINEAIGKLKPNRFACFVVGDFRDKKGLYRNFPALTSAAFCGAGAALYNEAILATSVGSASMRVTKQFNSGRKFAKTHQNVLVFVKGDWKKAAQAIEKP